MDNELMALMQVLSNKPYLTLKDIEVSAGITRRQATYRIDKVNDLCGSIMLLYYNWEQRRKSVWKPSHERSLRSCFRK